MVTLPGSISIINVILFYSLLILEYGHPASVAYVSRGSIFFIIITLFYSLILLEYGHPASTAFLSMVTVRDFIFLFDA